LGKRISKKGSKSEIKGGRGTRNAGIGNEGGLKRWKEICEWSVLDGKKGISWDMMERENG
jgi:hypothetical protein